MNMFLSSLVALLGLIMVGCTSGGQSSPVSLPLSTSQPTLIFFYTDN